MAAAAQANANANFQAAVHQKHMDDINRAMFQRFARQQTGPPIGMVSASRIFSSIRLPAIFIFQVPVAGGPMNLVQPLMRGPAMALTPQGALIGSNMIRQGPPGMGGMPTGRLNSFY